MGAGAGAGASGPLALVSPEEAGESTRNLRGRDTRARTRTMMRRIVITLYLPDFLT